MTSANKHRIIQIKHKILCKQNFPETGSVLPVSHQVYQRTMCAPH
jgi:hypothetical protein